MSEQNTLQVDDDDEEMILRNSEGHSGQLGGTLMFSVIKDGELWLVITDVCKILELSMEAANA